MAFWKSRKRRKRKKKRSNQENVDCGNLLSFKQPEDVYEAVRNCIRGAGEFRSGDAVPDVVYREKHRTVREFSVWSDAQRHIAFPDQSFLSHEF